MSLLSVLILGWCSSNKKQISVLDCTDNECVVNTVEWIQDTFVKNCVNENIALNTGLNNKILSADYIWALESRNVDKLVRECIGYKVQNPSVTPSNVPMYPAFHSSFWSNFLETYLLMSFLGWPRYYYNQPISVMDSNTYQNDCRRNNNCWRWAASVVPYSAKSIWSSYSRSSFQSTTKWTLGTAWKSRSSSSSSSLG